MSNFKKCEFNAHFDKITSLFIGRKSARVLATGCKSGEVRIWALGSRVRPLLKFDAGPRQVTAVCFDDNESLVLAGFNSGECILWDLNTQKQVYECKNLGSQVTAFSFHPYGEFFACGLSDNNFRVWDVRKPRPIQTYKGHQERVCALRFSPDGRWIVSGDEGGNLKIWDLTSSGLVSNMKHVHKAAVTAIEFHPSEFLMFTRFH